MSNMMTFNKIYSNLISEQDEIDDSNSLSDDENSEELDSTKESMDKDGFEFKFSNNLANEFTQTMNNFSVICAKMIKKRLVSKDLYDEFTNVHSKLKNLVEAGRNSK